jgi:hypothetical protein
LQNTIERKMTDHLHNDHKNILKGLESADSLKVIETIEELHTSGKTTDIPLLIEFLHLTQNPEIKSKIISLFANLKESNAIPLIVEAIRNQKYEPELKELVASCWENGMDYSDYLELFIDLLIENEFIVALEAYTVIMNMTAQIDQQKIDIEIDKIEKALAQSSEQKKPLMLDVIDFLPSIAL